MNKLTTLLTTAFLLAVVASPPALAFGDNEGIPLITISDASKFKTRYRITGVGPSNQVSFAEAITDTGIIVGGAYPVGKSINTYRTFVFQNNRLRFLNNFKHKTGKLPGSSFTRSQVNNSGRVVGTTVLNGIETPAVYTLATNRIQPLPKQDNIVNSIATTYNGINDFGLLSGFTYTVGLLNHPFIFNKGKFTELGNLPTQNSNKFANPAAINNQGTVVGSMASDGRGFSVGPFLYDKGVLKNILPPDIKLQSSDNLVSQATDINQLGQVVAFAQGQIDSFDPEDKFVNYSFIYHQGRYTKFQVAKKGETVGGAISNAAINNRGEIVGFRNIDSPGRALIYRNGIVAELNTLIPANSGWVLLEANDINNLGQIVGMGFKNGRRQAFLLTPTNLTRPQ